MSDQYQYELATSANLTLGASSVSAAIPANTELLAIACTGNCHFATGQGSATATVTSPLLLVNAGVVIIRVNYGDNFIAAIQDAGSTGIFNFCKVTER